MRRPRKNDVIVLDPETEGAHTARVLGGRPPIGPKISTRVTPKEAQDVDALAASAEWTRSEAVRFLVRTGLRALRRDRGDDADLRAAIEAQAVDAGVTPAGLLGVGYGAVMAQRGGR